MGPLPVTGKDELGQLTETFNEMQQQLRSVDVARKEFIATASHELRTPIFSLGGFVELLEDEEVDEQTKAEFLTTMREQVSRLRKLTTNLLDLSQLDAGSLEVELDSVPLRTIAGQVANEFAAAAAQAAVTIELADSGPDQEVEALCDSERVAQILRVLLSNAIMHTGKGAHVLLSAGVSNGKTGKTVAEVTVRDDGPGIPARDLPYIFERFHSGNEGQGSGLGLAIARELAERMKGELGVASEPGNTVFKLTLPLVGDWAPPSPAPKTRSGAEADARAAAGSGNERPKA
jgi:signal transduction histidine kinase